MRLYMEDAWWTDYKNDPNLLPFPIATPFVMTFTSYLQEQNLLLHPLNLGWPCDLFWPIECSRSDNIPVPNLGLRSLV